MEYYIKEIEKDDLDDYMLVNTYAWDETYRGIMSDDFLDKILKEIKENTKKAKEKFYQLKIDEPNYKRYILYVKDNPVGIFGICRSRDEKYPDSGELGCIYLLNKVKKQGYGKIMFEEAKEELKKMGYKDMIIYCLKENPTKNFYEHMGGEYIYEKERNIGGKDLIEVIYYYDQI